MMEDLSQSSRTSVKNKPNHGTPCSVSPVKPRRLSDSNQLGTPKDLSLTDDILLQSKPHRIYGERTQDNSFLVDMPSLNKKMYHDLKQGTSHNVKVGPSKHQQNQPVVQLSWTVLSPQGPTLSHHVGVVIRNRFYVHGGIDKKASIKPLDKLYVMDMESYLWSEVRAPHSPALSHHVGLAIDERYFLLVGGWNGHKRSTEIYVFDVQAESWRVMDTIGFPPNGGLSSHSIKQLESGDLLIIGREGGARIQRRWTHVYILRGSILKNRFVYEEQNYQPASRSGHTMHIVPGNFLCIIGGRADEPLEMLHGFRSMIQPHVSNILVRLRELYQDKVIPATGLGIPAGRRNHVSIASGDTILIHGGEKFKGTNQEPVGELILVVTRPNVQWYHLGQTPEARAGHVCFVYNNNICFHGGEGPNGIVYGSTYKLCL